MMTSLDVLTLEDVKCLLPTRSHLYCFEPIGIGTLYVEQLTSYIQRLAQAHCVTTKTLVMRELVPLLNKDVMFSGGYNPSLLYEAFSANGFGNTAKKWVPALELLTLRRDLRNLTMLAWRDVIPVKRLLRQSRAWCPLCLEEMRIRNSTVYEPLLWALVVVTSCVQHERLLTNICPGCKKTVPGLGISSRVACCSRCNQWLGCPTNIDETPVQMLSAEELHWQQFVQRSLDSMFAQAPAIGTPLQPSNIVRALTRCIDQVANGNISMFSDYVGVSCSVMKSYAKNERLLSLSVLLRICYCLDRNPLEFLILEGITVLERSNIQLHRAPFEQVLSERRNNIYSTYEQQCLLHAALKREEFPPPSWAEMARRLGCRPDTLKKRFPDEWRQVSERYQAYRKANAARRVEQLCEQVRHAVRILAAQGESVGMKAIETSIGVSGELRNPVVRTAYIEELQLLGYLQS